MWMGLNEGDATTAWRLRRPRDWESRQNATSQHKQRERERKVAGDGEKAKSKKTSVLERSSRSVHPERVSGASFFCLFFSDDPLSLC
ncbi:unnamed protein product [Ixodes hexagonus]